MRHHALKRTSPKQLTHVEPNSRRLLVDFKVVHHSL
jgi:hypothetical protein